MTTVNPRTIAQVREYTNFPELVEEYLPLRKSGCDWVAQCPFHDDRSPSFRVYSDHGFCFACQASADCFSFLKRVEGLSFIEALRRLADRAGIPLDAKPISPKAMRYARDEADMCRWWWERKREDVMSQGRAAQAEDPIDQDWCRALYGIRVWIDAQGYSERFTIFRGRATERERKEYRKIMADKAEFADAWLGLADAARA